MYNQTITTTAYKTIPVIYNPCTEDYTEIIAQVLYTYIFHYIYMCLHNHGQARISILSFAELQTTYKLRAGYPWSTALVNL